MSEREYMAVDVFRNQTVRVPERFIANYRDAVEPTTGRPQFRFLEDIDGFQALPDGTIKETKIPADRIDATGRKGSAFILPAPGLKKLAKEHSAYRKKKKIVEDDPAVNTFLRSAASGLTGGLTTAALDAWHGEEYEELRAMAMQDRGLAHFGGRAAALVAMGFIPIPGLGRAAGAVFPKLKGAANVGTVFELGAATSQLARGRFAGQFAKKFVGATAFGATVEAPMSLALASADIVDNNKDYTMEAVASEAVMQYALGVSIAGLTSIPFAIIGATAGAGARAASKVGDEFLEAEAKMLARSPVLGEAAKSEAVDSLLKGGIRNFSRRRLRGRMFGLGDAMETQMYKLAHKATHHKTGRLMAENKWVRMIAGTDADDYIRYHKTVSQAIDDLSSANTARTVIRAADTIMLNLDADSRMYKQLAAVKENASDVVAARRQAVMLRQQADKFAELAQKVEFRHPRFTKKAPGSVDVTANLKHGLEASGAGKVTFRSANYFDQLDETLNLRRQIPFQRRAALDTALEDTFPGITAYLKQFDGFDKSANMLRAAAAEYGDDLSGVRGAYNLIGPEEGTNVNAFRARLGQLNGTFRGLTDPKVNAIRDISPFFREKIYTKKGMVFNIDTKLNDLRSGVEALGALNNAVRSLRASAKPLFPSQVPKTQAERLAAQLQTVVTTRTRMKDAIMWAALKGGGARHTAAFGGVYYFRNMASLAEKQQLFAAYHEAIVQNASTPQALQAMAGDIAGPVASFDFGAGVSLAATVATGFAYLNQQMPHSADARIGPEEYSAAEIDNFFEAVGALLDPASVIATAADGSTSDQAVDAFRTVYPELYIDAVIDVAEFIRQFEDQLDHATLLGFDTFTGYALGYSDGPGPELTMQPPFAQTAQQAQALGNIGGFENRQMNFQLTTTPAQKVSLL